MPIDAAVLKPDPAAIAGPEGSACDAAKALFRTAHVFSVLFTTLVFIFTGALLILLVVTLYLLFADGIKGTTIAGGAGTIATGLGVGFLTTQMKQQRDAAREALKDVRKHCGEDVVRAMS